MMWSTGQSNAVYLVFQPAGCWGKKVRSSGDDGVVNKKNGLFFSQGGEIQAYLGG